MSETTATATPDLVAVTVRQQRAWASGDYATVAARIPLISERLCDAADLRSGSRVLDVAGGSGNTALAAARCGCEVVSLDYVLPPGARADAGGLRGARGGVRRGRRPGAPLPRRDVRRRRLGRGRDVRARPSALGRRDAAGLPARGHDRARQLDARRLHRRSLPHRRRARPAPPGGGWPLRPSGARRSTCATSWRTGCATSASAAASSRSASTRPGTSRASSATTTGRPWSRSRRSTPTAGSRWAAEMDDLVRRFDRIGGDGPVAIPAEYLEIVATRA